MYPDGSYDIIAADRPIFSPRRAEDGDAKRPRPKPQEAPVGAEDEDAKRPRPKPKAKPSSLARAQQRARARVRRLALANEFRWFVTLTVDPQKIDSYDVAAVTRRLNQWLSNHVRRNGLAYILVPERHKSGRVHYHGFFNDAIVAVDSGHCDDRGHTVYNLPQWDYGFTTAIELYGEYHAAVGYVCKYIGKESEKIGGRWYFSGGNLQEPVEMFVDICRADIQEMQTEEFVEEYGNGWIKGTPVAVFAGVNGLR